MTTRTLMLMIVCTLGPGCPQVGERAAVDDRLEGLRLIGSPKELAIREGASHAAKNLGQKDLEGFLNTGFLRHTLTRNGITIRTASPGIVAEGMASSRVSIYRNNTLVYETVYSGETFGNYAWQKPHVFRPGFWMQKIGTLCAKAQRAKAEEERADLERRYGAVERTNHEGGLR